MSDQTGKTTIEVTHEIWAALDKRKDRGDSFNDVIQRLIDNSAVSFGDLQEIDQPVEYGDIEREWPDDVDENGCAETDIITGEPCGEDVVCRQEYRWKDEDEWSYFYYCEEHAPQIDTPV
jgi:hypothetical protein